MRNVKAAGEFSSYPSVLKPQSRRQRDRKTHRGSNEKTSTKQGDEDKKKRSNVLQKGGKEKKVMRQ